MKQVETTCIANTNLNWHKLLKKLGLFTPYHLSYGSKLVLPDKDSEMCV